MVYESIMRESNVILSVKPVLDKLFESKNKTYSIYIKGKSGESRIRKAKA